MNTCVEEVLKFLRHGCVKSGLIELVLALKLPAIYTDPETTLDDISYDLFSELGPRSPADKYTRSYSVLQYFYTL